MTNFDIFTHDPQFASFADVAVNGGADSKETSWAVSRSKLVFCI